MDALFHGKASVAALSGDRIDVVAGPPVEQRAIVRPRASPNHRDRSGWTLKVSVQITMLVAMQHQVAAHPAEQLVESTAIPQRPQNVEMLRQGRMMDEQQSKVIAGAIQHFFEPPKLPTA